jgi:hypothetical protein
MGGAEYAKLGRAELDADARRFLLRARRQRRATTRSRTARRMRELIYGIGGGIPGGRTLKASSRRLVDR